MQLIRELGPCRKEGRDLEEDDSCLTTSLMGCHMRKREGLLCVAVGIGARQMEGSGRGADVDAERGKIIRAAQPWRATVLNVC